MRIKAFARQAIIGLVTFTAVASGVSAAEATGPASTGHALDAGASLGTLVQRSGNSLNVTFSWDFVFDAGTAVTVKDLAGSRPPAGGTGTLAYTGSETHATISGLSAASDWSFALTGAVQGISTTFTKSVLRPKIVITSQRWDGYYVRVSGRIQTALGAAANVPFGWSCVDASGKVNTASGDRSNGRGVIAVYSNQRTPGVCTVTVSPNYTQASYGVGTPYIVGGAAKVTTLVNVPFMIGTNAIENFFLFSNTRSKWTTYYISNAGSGVRVLVQVRSGSAWKTVSTIRSTRGGKLTFVITAVGKKGSTFKFRLYAPAAGRYLAGTVLINRPIFG